jgi:hypothetical protein
MAQHSSSWSTILSAAALGAAAMYVFDPDKGRRRRAVGRDKIRTMVGDARKFVDVAARDANYRWQGVRAIARRRFRRQSAPDDLMLIERVRARMGRVVSHPHAVQVGANRGRVTLSGPILAREVEPMLETVRAVWGVESIDNHLVAHDTAENIPSLQGGAERAERAELLQESWAPSLRMAAIVGGSLLAVCALRSRSLSGIALTAVGIGLTARGATNVPLSRLAGGAPVDRLPQPEQYPGASLQ